MFVSVLSGKKFDGVLDKFLIDAISNNSRKHIICDMMMHKYKNPFRQLCVEDADEIIKKLLEMKQVDFAKLAVVIACENNKYIIVGDLGTRILREIKSLAN